MGTEVLNIFQDPSFHQYLFTYKAGCIGLFFFFNLKIFFNMFGISSGISGRKFSKFVLHVTFSMVLKCKNANDVMYRTG